MNPVGDLFPSFPPSFRSPSFFPLSLLPSFCSPSFLSYLPLPGGLRGGVSFRRGPPSVIPVQTGIHPKIHPSVYVSDPRRAIRRWIPAFAGMTEGGGMTEETGMTPAASAPPPTTSTAFNCNRNGAGSPNGGGTFLSPGGSRGVSRRGIRVALSALPLSLADLHSFGGGGGATKGRGQECPLSFSFRTPSFRGALLPSFPCKRESIRASIRLLVCQTPALPCEDGFPLSRE